MTALRELYKCNICGNVIEVVHEGAPALVCCGEDMEKLEAKLKDVGTEKHVPVVSESEGGILVRVGEIEHPMEDKHYIKFIEVLTKDKVLRKELKPGDKPEAVFSIGISDMVSVREYCNIHGLWENVR
jgi:superoxide reductase